MPRLNPITGVKMAYMKILDGIKRYILSILFLLIRGLCDNYRLFPGTTIIVSRSTRIIWEGGNIYFNPCRDGQYAVVVEKFIPVNGLYSLTISLSPYLLGYSKILGSLFLSLSRLFSKMKFH